MFDIVLCFYWTKVIEYWDDSGNRTSIDRQDMEIEQISKAIHAASELLLDKEGSLNIITELHNLFQYIKFPPVGLGNYDRYHILMENLILLTLDRLVSFWFLNSNSTVLQFKPDLPSSVKYLFKSHKTRVTFIFHVKRLKRPSSLNQKSISSSALPEFPR